MNTDTYKYGSRQANNNNNKNNNKGALSRVWLSCADVINESDTEALTTIKAVRYNNRPALPPVIQ